MIQENDTEKYWIAAKKLVGRTLLTQKGGVKFEITKVDKGLQYKRKTGTFGTYSRQKIEGYCRHRQNGGEITAGSLCAAGVIKNLKDWEYSYIPAIVDEILKVINYE